MRMFISALFLVQDIRILLITVLEYQRLQGFPDWFKFEGTENSDLCVAGTATQALQIKKTVVKG